MASSPCIYEVFLNFRGEDTRAIFTCHLYDALSKRKKIRTFIDDEELRRGDEISPALLNAIQGSKISVVIFSTDYASSKWCLYELVEILECKHTNGQIIIPVFYGVSPSDVRHQTGIFGVGFGKLEQQFKEKPEMVQRWRDALRETSGLAGHESTKFRHDAELVNKIVEDVLKKLEKITVSTDSSNGLVGLNSRIEQIKPFLCMDLSDTVQIVGIWGMGGIGKTTLAEAIFNQFSGEFDGKYFAKNVRRKSETEGGLEDLQKEMLSTILSEKLEVAGANIPHFTKERVRRMKVLIVLDDVNEVGQLEGLIGELDQFVPGSRIVVTTRDKGVLEKFGVEEKKIYRVNGMDFHEAFEHFCNFAFKEKHCPEDFKPDSRRVVKYADGNPLVLKVLGSSLKGKSHWGKVLHDLNRICESDIHAIYKKLKISFDELTPRVQSIFLDIACFFEGEDKDFVARILDDSESVGLDVLVDKSLITVSYNRLQMHDILQEMGRRQESEKEPGKRKRLWDPKEIRRVLKHNMYEIEKLLSMSIEEQLSYSKVQLPNGLDYLPKKLRYLHWDTYPLRTLPSNFKPKNLVGLNLRFSKVEQIWEGEMACVPSSIQNFKYLKFPQISGKITRLYLSQSAIEEVPSSIECLTDLEKLDLRDCERLKRISTRTSLIVLPGSEIPDWFNNQSSGSSIGIQLPPHSSCRNLIGFAFCAVLNFKKVGSCYCCNVFGRSQLDLEIKTLSETKHVDLGFSGPATTSVRNKYSLDSDHVILGFKPCLNVGFPDGYHHTTVSLKFFNNCYQNQKGHKVKRYGVCPVYANPSETKANTFTLNFATEVWKLDDLPSASGTAASEFDSSGTSDEEELEPSPKRICRADCCFLLLYSVVVFITVVIFIVNIRQNKRSVSISGIQLFNLYCMKL
ncbi:ADP-ribosyl cyclase/cyclic ADP-ribose hydrolase [Citrus sinensis]|uniref:ADP-ribosyl cyclase/cyclic ADP-ribose hydrolase n=1 Tax=Citrus sinensis TaxID=2711 RepID=A0ACB8MB90_CITSI|nr:ADP-ribosyl cyclase/cyclic ADP-ribose hydrolase [Citrus sinensis]